MTQVIYRYKFGKIGKKSVIISPLQMDSTASIHLENRVCISQNSWLMGNKDEKCTLIIEDETIIGHYAHIIALGCVHIGKKVLIADKVFITDCTHEYKDVNFPVKEQPVTLLAPVYIGDGAWIGENVCILGASVGKNSVVGSNSVVTHDIPDYSVAVGNPARVIKKYSFESASWVNV